MINASCKLQKSALQPTAPEFTYGCRARSMPPRKSYCIQTFCLNRLAATAEWEDCVQIDTQHHFAPRWIRQGATQVRETTPPSALLYPATHAKRDSRLGMEPGRDCGDDHFGRCHPPGPDLPARQ